MVAAFSQPFDYNAHPVPMSGSPILEYILQPSSAFTLAELVDDRLGRPELRLREVRPRRLQVEVEGVVERREREGGKVVLIGKRAL